jgi:hypothetical protein
MVFDDIKAMKYSSGLCHEKTTLSFPSSHDISVTGSVLGPRGTEMPQRSLLPSWNAQSRRH